MALSASSRSDAAPDVDSGNGDGTPRFAGSDLIDRRTMSRWRYPFEFRRRAGSYDAVVIVGSLGFADRYQDVVAGIMLKSSFWRDVPVLVVTDATWERSSASLSSRFGGKAVATWVARAFIRALDGPHVVYCVLSEEERSTFGDRWGVDDGRVVFTHYALDAGRRLRRPRLRRRLPLRRR